MYPTQEMLDYAKMVERVRLLQGPTSSEQFLRDFLQQNPEAVEGKNFNIILPEEQKKQIP